MIMVRIMMMIMVRIMMMMTVMIVPHVVVVVGKAPLPMVLVVVGFQLLIHVKGALKKAKSPKNDNN